MAGSMRKPSSTDSVYYESATVSTWETEENANEPVRRRRNSSETQRPEKKYSFVEGQIGDILHLLRMSVNDDELTLKESKKIQNEQQAAQLFNLLQKKKDEEGNETASDLKDKQDEIRLARLKESRPKWLTFTLELLFHLMVFANFFMSWYDSVRLLLEDAKMNMWYLDDEYNCLEIVKNVDYVDHSINIMHALLSCAVLYVHKRNSANLCLAWICSQAANIIFKTFQHFHNSKFDIETSAGIGPLIAIIIFNVCCSLLMLHKYYDLTDRYKERTRFLGTAQTSERSLNAQIIFKNESHFLQRKALLRQVTKAQTYAILRKIGKHAKEGLRVDQTSLDMELNAAKMALADCATVDNNNMMYMLKKAYANRMKELEAIQREREIQRRKDFEHDLNEPFIIQSEIY